MKLLKQTTSGEIYVWSEDLAKRPDMVEFVKEAPVKPVVQPEPAYPVEIVEAAAAKPVAKKGKK